MMALPKEGGGEEVEALDLLAKVQRFNNDPTTSSDQDLASLASDILQELRLRQQERKHDPPVDQNVHHDSRISSYFLALKALSRIPAALPILSLPHHLDILTSHPRYPEALKALCNILLQHEPSRTHLLAAPIASWLPSASGDAERRFLVLRVAFLVGLEGKVEGLGWEEVLEAMKEADVDTVREGCKVIFNIVMREREHHESMLSNKLCQALLDIARTWRTTDIVHHILNIFLNLEPVLVADTIRKDLDLFIDCLERTTCLPDASSRIEPTIMLFQRLAKTDEGMRKSLMERICPEDVDRSVPMGDGRGLVHSLVKLLGSVESLRLRELVEELYVTLFEGNVQALSQYVGFGNAAGILVNRGHLLAPTSPQDPGASSSSSSHGAHGPHVNPVTGAQLPDSGDELPSNLADMTEEEKEREAERLFVLFERLNQTGVIKVVNPVNAASMARAAPEAGNDGQQRN